MLTNQKSTNIMKTMFSIVSGFLKKIVETEKGLKIVKKQTMVANVTLYNLTGHKVYIERY